MLSMAWSWILVLTVTHISQSYGSYLVLAPTVFRPDSDYNVEVSIVGASSSVNVQVSLSQKNTSPIGFSSLTIGNNEARKFTLKIGSVVPDGAYELTVKGTGGLTFTNSTGVALNRMTHMILIQFDKAIYKPNQMVRIRVLSVDPENLSLKKIPTDLSISDERGNKLDEWKGAISDTGVITWDYQLSDQPPLGMWKVVAKNQGGEFTKTFKVDKYVLPRFEVTVVALPSFIVRNMPKITFQVKAKYTYGKAVQGTYRITVGQETYTAKVTGTEGSHDFVVDTSKLISKSSNTVYYGYDSLQAVAEVTETTSDVTLKADPLTVKIYSHPIKIAFDESTSQVFRPGLPISVVVKVTDAGGMKPATDYVGKTVTVTMTIASTPFKKTLSIQSDGTVSTEFDIPADTKTTSNINLQAQINGETDVKTTRYLRGYMTLLDAAIEVGLQSNSEQPFKVGDQFEIDVQTTKTISHVAYIIISRGEIVHSGTLDMQNSQRKTHLISATLAMAPKAKLIVYAIYDNGKEKEVLADSIDLDINGIFQNMISLEFSERQERVGKSVDMTITSGALSDFFVLAVDQSVLLLETGNDLTKDGVKKEIEKFGIEEKKDNGNPRPMPMFAGRRFIPWPTPSSSAPQSTGALLKARGLLSLTDMNIKPDDHHMNLWRKKNVMNAVPMEMDKGLGKRSFVND